jgi:hypothetical protein
MKTAMQELIEFIESTNNTPHVNLTIMDKAKKLLEKEKEQIIDDFETGKENAHYSITNPNEYIIGEFYYNQKYNQ